MFEVRVDKNQLITLNRELKLAEKDLLNITTKTFKGAANDFTKRVIKRLRSESNIKLSKIKSRVRKYVVDDLKIKVFNGLFRVGLTNWGARQTKQGVTFGAKGKRQLRKSAFIATMPEGGKLAVKRTGRFAVASKGKYRGKKREILQKQVESPDDIFTPILEDEVGFFYDIFSKKFDEEVRKWLMKQL